MRRAAALLLALATLPAGTAAAQEAPPCEAPRIDGFQHAPGPLRAGEPEWIAARVQGAASVAIDRPDRTRSSAPVSGGYATLTHAFRRAIRQRIVATATAECGASS